MLFANPQRQVFSRQGTFLSRVSHAFVSVHCCLEVTCWEKLTSWLLFVMFNCVFVTFPCGIQGQVWYLIVLIPDLCRLSYFYVSECCEASTKATCWWGRGLTFWWTTESSRTQKGSSTCLSFSKSKANITTGIWNLQSNLSCDMWFSTMWCFDKCTLRGACAASF